MTYSGRMQDDGWSSWLAVMLYILIWLVSARLPVPSVHRVGGRCVCRIKQSREGRQWSEGSYASRMLSESKSYLCMGYYTSFKSFPVYGTSNAQFAQTLSCH